MPSYFTNKGSEVGWYNDSLKDLILKHPSLGGSGGLWAVYNGAKNLWDNNAFNINNARSLLPSYNAYNSQTFLGRLDYLPTNRSNRNRWLNLRSFHAYINDAYNEVNIACRRFEPILKIPNSVKILLATLWIVNLHFSNYFFTNSQIQDIPTSLGSLAGQITQKIGYAISQSSNDDKIIDIAARGVEIATKIAIDSAAKSNPIVGIIDLAYRVFSQLWNLFSDNTLSRFYHTINEISINNISLYIQKKIYDIILEKKFYSKITVAQSKVNYQNAHGLPNKDFIQDNFIKPSNVRYNDIVVNRPLISQISIQSIRKYDYKYQIIIPFSDKFITTLFGFLTFFMAIIPSILTVDVANVLIEILIKNHLKKKNIANLLSKKQIMAENNKVKILNSLNYHSYGFNSVSLFDNPGKLVLSSNPPSYYPTLV